MSRAILVLFPLFMLGTLAAATVWGDNGLLALNRLNHELGRRHLELASIERENQQLLRELLLLDRDPLAIERAVADELRWGAPGATLYVFDGRDARSVPIDQARVHDVPALPTQTDVPDEGL